jgi:PAS domain S-box-containing protein
VITSESDVRTELTGRFLRDSPLAEYAHVALGLTVTLLLVGIHPPLVLAGWFAALVVASVIRQRVRKHYAAKFDPPADLPWPVIATIVAVGLVWSAGAMPLLLGTDPEMALRVMIVECGLAAAATFTFAATVTGFRVFIASIFIPLIGGMVSHGLNRASITNVLLIIVFGGTMLAIQRRGSAQLTRSLQLHHDLDRSRLAAEAGQAELRESEQQLFQFLESMPVGVVVIDRAGQLYFSNAAAKQIAGPILQGRPNVAEMTERASAYVPGTQQPYAYERSPAVRALRGETSVDQIEIVTPTGVRLVEVSGSPILDREKDVAYAVAVITDLSGRHSADSRRAALNAVLTITADARSEEELVTQVLRLLNERFSFSLAELWMAEGSSVVLRRLGSSLRNDDARIQAFEEASGALSFRRGEGLPGAVWKTGESIWRKRSAEDDRTFRRPGGVVEAGLRTAVSVPVFVAGEAQGALVLFTTESRDSEGPITETRKAIGAQVGGAIGRRRADAAVRAAEERYRQLVEASTDLVWETDLQGKWSFLNAASRRIYGIPPEELIGRAFTERSDPKQLERDREMFGRLSRGEIITEYETVHRNGVDAPVVVSTSAAPVHGLTGSIVGYHGIIRDVGDRAAARAALRAARDAAEQAAAAKSAFLANMSHEIRTPMNGVLGVAELLQGTDLDVEQRRMVDLIATSGQALLTVINEILDFSKIEAQQLEIESVDFDLHDLVESTVKLTASSVEGDVEIVADIGNDVPTHVLGDPTRLRQVLSNLLGNAIKFTHEGEVVTSVERIAVVGRMARVRFAVRDTGIGMSKETLEGIFEPFRQADSSTTRRYGGTGLGLSISRRLVELMGGHLTVTSQEGSGSQFGFELFMPVSPEPARITPPSLNGARVLLVDDNATNQRVLSSMLHHEGVDVEVASTGASAIERLRAASKAGKPFGVVVTDVQMPVMDGFELVRQIRDDEPLASIPVVMATSGSRRGDVARASDLRIATVLIKPVSRREIAKAVQMAMAGTSRGAPEQRGGIEPATRALSILIAEDNPINQEVARAMLARRGHAIDIVADGRAAVNAARAKHYDVILMDIQMPELDGLDATREIRKRKPAAPQRIIALTANVLPGERERCLANGMDAYLAKPFAARDLFEVVEGPLKGTEATSAAATVARPAGKLIDLDDLRADLKAAGIEESLPVLVQLFLRDGPGRIDAILKAVETRSGPNITAAAHAMKSAAGAVRATRLMSLLATVERTAKAGDIATATAQVESVVAEHRAVREWLESGEWQR